MSLLDAIFAAKLCGGGGGGESTIAWKPTVAADGTISWSRTSSTTKPADQNIRGADGADGFSPTVTIAPIHGGNRVTITDAEGEHEFNVMDGSGSGGGTIDVVPSDDKFTVNDPDGLNSASLQVGGAGVLLDISGSQVAELPNKSYVDNVVSGAFVIDTANPCSYNELQNAINTPKVVLIKHEGVVYPFVEEWESDESTKRYVNIASLQRQGVDKGAMYFFFEATIGDFDSPMAYSSNFAQPTGKPYTDSVAGNLDNLTTTEKTNLVGAVNEVNDKTALPTTEVYNADSTAADFNPVATEYVKDGGVTYTKYRFYYRTSFLAAADATKTFDFSTLMTDYIVKEWTNVTGFTDNGHKLSSGRTDNLGNVAILQQLGRNSKQLIVRSYGDLSSHTAILQLEFYGTKN